VITDRQFIALVGIPTLAQVAGMAVNVYWFRRIVNGLNAPHFEGTGQRIVGRGDWGG
jgi:hypothetical protein